MEEKLKREFIGLACRLSPENLSCDGEISKAQVRRRFMQIKREWKALEKLVGCKVSENEVEDWMLEEYKGLMG